MDQRQQLVENIKLWVKNDNEIRQLQAEIKKRRETNKTLSQNLGDVMKENNIDEFDINDGRIIYSQKKVKSALSKKHLIDSLMKYFENDKGMVEQLSNHILDSRKETVKDTINRKIDK